MEVSVVLRCPERKKKMAWGKSKKKNEEFELDEEEEDMKDEIEQQAPPIAPRQQQQPRVLNKEEVDDLMYGHWMRLGKLLEMRSGM